jgi:hypothetical protein
MLGKPIPMPIPNYGYLVHVKDHDLPDNILLHPFTLFETVHASCILLLGPACWHLFAGT